jgi:hypothetical protein
LRRLVNEIRIIGGEMMKRKVTAVASLALATSVKEVNAMKRKALKPWRHQSR